MLRLVVAFFLVFFTLWECCGGVFLSPVSMCASVTTLHNKNTATTTACHFEVGRVCFLMGVFSLFVFEVSLTRQQKVWQLNSERIAAEDSPSSSLFTMCPPCICFFFFLCRRRKEQTKNPTNPFLIYKSCNLFIFSFFLFCLLANS